MYGHVECGCDGGREPTVRLVPLACGARGYRAKDEHHTPRLGAESTGIVTPLRSVRPDRRLRVAGVGGASSR